MRSPALVPFVALLLPLQLPLDAQAKPDSFAAEVGELRRQADLVDALQRRTARYFLAMADEQTGLVRARSRPDSPAGIAATGFALPTWALAAERGWLPRERAAALTARVLRFLRDAEQGEAADATGRAGFYYHLLDLGTGRRAGRSALSTIDTAILIAGARFAHGYYDRDTAAEQEIRALADLLTERVRWDWVTPHGEGRDAGTIALDWRPESGFLPTGRSGYGEALLLYVIAAGSGFEGAREAWDRWVADYDWRRAFPGLELLACPPLRGHQHPQVFLDLRGRPDAFLRDKGIDYFENSRRAVRAQQRYAVLNPREREGYDALIWGLSTCEGPGPAHDTDAHAFAGYAARGCCGPDLVQADDGTLAPTAAAASIVFAPDLVVPTIAAMHDRYGAAGLWGEYGFKAAFNPTADWIADDYLGVDEGAIALMIENWRNEFVWRVLRRDPLLRHGLDVLGFAPAPPHRFEDQIAAFEARDRKTPPPAAPVLFVGSSSIAFWRTVAADMAPMVAINRGFGGSEASDVIHYFARVVAPYRPRAIVLYEGDNDVAAGKTPVEVLVHHREIARLVARHLPGTPLLILAIKPSISRQKLWPTMQRANALLAGFCAEHADCHFVDIARGMLDADGAIRSDIFREDMLHMNARGYEGWTALIKPRLEALLR